MRLIWQSPKLYRNSGLFLRTKTRWIKVLPW